MCTFCKYVSWLPASKRIKRLKKNARMERGIYPFHPYKA